MIPGSFEYHRPTSRARVIAGGHSLIPMMKLRLAVPEHLIDLQDVAGLAGIDAGGDTIEIGAMTTQAEIVESDVLTERCPILKETALQIADPQVRYCGTLGGNVANGDPGNDMPGLMQCLNADFVLLGPDGERSVAARAFYEAAYFTARSDDEILTKVRIPAPAAGHGYAYEKQKRKIGDYATAAAAVVLTVSGGQCASASIALTNVADTPLYAEAASQALVGSSFDKAAVDAAVAAAEAITEPVSDGRGPAAYRTKIAGVMVRRAIENARSRAG